jgi:phosphate transport system protein
MLGIVLENELHEMNELHVQMLRLGSLVYETLTQVLEALRTTDQELAKIAAVADQTIYELRLSVERQAFDLLNTSQPIAGLGVRYLTSLPLIAVDLERISDKAVDIAQMLLRLVPLLPMRYSSLSSSPSGSAAADEMLRELLALGQQAGSMFRRTMRAFVDRDTATARQVWTENAAMHTRCYAARRDISTSLARSHAVPALQHDSDALQPIMCVLAIVHCIERIADYCANICERIVYMELNETAMQPVMVA